MLITVEGLDYAGKTTAVEAIKSYCERLSVSVVVVREPGGTPLGEEIRRHLKSVPCTPAQELALFLVARRALVDTVILPALLHGKIVIADRYIDSTYAYQQYGRGLHVDCSEFPTPNITYWIDITMQTFAERLRGSIQQGGADRIERSGLEFYRRVERGFFLRWAYHRQYIVRIDGEQPLDGVHNQIITHLAEALPIERGM